MSEAAVSHSAVSASARVIGRLAQLFLDCASGVAPDRCGVGPFAPEIFAAMAPPARAALADPLAVACGLAAVDLTAAYLDRIETEPDARNAGIIATLPADDLVRLARALASIVYADLARRLVRKRDRDLFHAALGERAAMVAIRRTPFHAMLGSLALDNTSIADAHRPDPAATAGTASGGTDWERPATSAVIAGEPPMVRHSLAIVASWVAGIAPELCAVLRARFGNLGLMPELTSGQRAALGGFFAEQLSS